MSEPLLVTRDLVVRYGQIVAVDRISIEVRAGEVVGLLGPNGAGKSSLIKAIIGHVKASDGMITLEGARLDGCPVWRRARRGIGYSPEGRRIFSGMTVRENLEVASNEGARGRADRMAELYRSFPELARRQYTRGWQLSGGQQQMLAIARALMGRPRVLVLDEPALGLSPPAAQAVFDRIRNIAAEGGAVLFADQNVAATLAVADRAYVLRTGRVVAEGLAQNLTRDLLADAFLGS